MNFAILLAVVCTVSALSVWEPDTAVEPMSRLEKRRSTTLESTSPDQRIAELETTLPIHLKTHPGTTGFSVCGVQPGMTAAEVRALLGEPKSEGGENPLREEGAGGHQVQWWMNYEDHCRTGPHPTAHSWPHVGLDRPDGTVIYVAGSTVEENCGPQLWQGSAFDEITNLLGEYQGSSSDACYYGFQSMRVRGCDQTNDRYTYYLW